MNKIATIVISVLCGAAAGSGITYFLEERKYKKILGGNKSNKIEDEVETARLKFVADRKEEDRKEEDEAMAESDDDESDKAGYNLQEIKEKLRKGKMAVADAISSVTDYTKMYSASDIVDAKNDEPSNIFDEVESEETDGEEEDDKMISESEKAHKDRFRAPRIVSLEDATDENSLWTTEALFLYNNGILTDEDDNIIDGEEKDKMVGDCLTKYDFLHSDEKTIFVKCYELTTFYEIQKFNEPFDPD